MSESAKPNSLCPDVPPELAHHPKYRILRELGRGGMGVVYQARHKEMDRQVVIKVINRSLLDRPETLERFHREIRAAARLSHPNIVTAYDAERVGDAHMLVMEFVPGLSLAEVVQKNGPLPLANACHYGRQVALGLQHAHERDMVHRDIKPQNLMLTLKNQVKILDFGLAKILREEVTGTGLTSHNAYMGTPDYCAPEQATDARSADTRADLYSLGCTLYYLLSGRPPFRENTVVNTILAHLQKPPRPLPELCADVPAELWQVVARLLAKEPGQRYQKPIEVVQALAPFVKSGSKPEAKSGSVPVVGSPGKGTVIAEDNRQINRILREVPGQAPPKEVPAKDKVSPFESLGETSAHARKAKRAREARHRVPASGRWRWAVLAGVGVLLVLLGMWAGSVFKVKPTSGVFKAETKPQPSGGSDKPEDPKERGKGDVMEARGKGDTIKAETKPRVGTNRRPAGPHGKGDTIKAETKPQPSGTWGRTGSSTKGKDTIKAETKPQPSGGSDKPEDPKVRGKGDTIEVSLTEALKMKFAWVPPGKSWLGGGGGKPGTQEFTLAKGLWCGVYPVTQAEWQAVMGNNPSNFADHPRNPVEQVSWKDAQAFLQKLNSRLADSGLTYRLPSAEEWEYICRGGPISQNQSAYHFYFARSKSDLTPVPTNDLSSRQANFNGKYPAGSASKGPYLQATSEVGLYLPNPLGIYDLNGNVCQWTSTLGGSSRLFRGGSWLSDAEYCTASYRSGYEPSFRFHDVGFRVLAVPSGAK